MKYKSETEFSAHLREREPFGCYLLFGEPFLVRSYTKRIVKRAVGKSNSGEMDRIKFDGKSNLDEIQQQVITPPWTSPRKCVIVTDYPADKIGESDEKKLLQIIDEIPEFTVLIFRTDLTEWNGKKSAKQRRIQEKIEKAGCAMEFIPREGAALYKFLAGEAAKHGCEIATAECRLLAERCAGDMSLAYGEIQKLCAYCAYSNSGKITAEMIRRCTVETLDSNVYDMVRAMMRGSYNDVLRLLGQLLDQRIPGYQILAAVSGQYVDLYRAKAAQQSGKSAADILEAFRYRGRDFRVTNALRDAPKFSTAALTRSLEILRDGDLALKSSGIDERVILQQVVTGLFGCRRQSGGGAG